MFVGRRARRRSGTSFGSSVATSTSLTAVPIWVSAAAPALIGEWIAGDLHVHTCFSHDAYCGPGDDNTGPEEFYTLGGDITQRFTEAAVRGLDYLAITDHNDVRSQADPGFGAQGVIPVPGYENSLHGHAQMLGAKRIYANGNSSAGAVNAVASALRADGGVFQINHPGNELIEGPDPECKNVGVLDWTYGFDVKPDTLEVWNVGFHLQPPLPAGGSNDKALEYWDCWFSAVHGSPRPAGATHTGCRRPLSRVLAIRRRGCS